MDEFRPPQLSGEHVLQDWEQELSRLKNTIPVFYIVASIIIVLFLIVVILGVDVFHFW